MGVPEGGGQVALDAGKTTVEDDGGGNAETRVRRDALVACQEGEGDEEGEGVRRKGEEKTGEEGRGIKGKKIS